jgi:hypothetical protein
MVLTMSPQLESALAEQANRQGIAPEELAEDILRRSNCLSPQTIGSGGC